MKEKEENNIEKAEDRLEILKRIEELEKEGKFDVDPEDEDALVSAIEDNYQWETQSGDYENVDPLGPSDDEDSDDMDDAFDDYEDEEDYDI